MALASASDVKRSCKDVNPVKKGDLVFSHGCAAGHSCSYKTTGNAKSFIDTIVDNAADSDAETYKSDTSFTLTATMKDSHPKCDGRALELEYRADDMYVHDVAGSDSSSNFKQRIALKGKKVAP